MNLVEEGERATEMPKGKVIAGVMRHRAEELLIEFVDGTRLCVDGGISEAGSEDDETSP